MNTLRTTALMGALFGLLMLVGTALGGRNGLYIGFGIALLTNGVSYFFSDKIALASSGARPLQPGELPELEAMVGNLARNAEIPMPRLYIINEEQPNAFATGRSPSHSAVAVTAGLLRNLTQRELAGVIAHELAHVKNRDILTQTIAATIGGAVSFLARMALWFGGSRDEDGRGANPLAALLVAILAPIAAVLVQLALSRTREFAADHDGAMIAGDALGLASALRRIEAAAERRPMPVSPSYSSMYIQNPLGGDRLAGIAALFRTHPPTEQRIERLEALARENEVPRSEFAV